MSTTTRTYQVTGMTCTSCASKVSNALAKVEGLSVLDVDITTGTVTVTSTTDCTGELGANGDVGENSVDPEAVDAAVRAVITGSGYQVT